jgi:hypothetical protein
MKNQALVTLVVICVIVTMPMYKILQCQLEKITFVIEVMLCIDDANGKLKKEEDQI